MARDYYTDAEQLAQQLSEQGLADWSRQLRDVVAAGATPTEILMGVRWVLSELLASGDASPGIQATAAELRDAINGALGG